MKINEETNGKRVSFPRTLVSRKDFGEKSFEISPVNYNNRATFSCSPILCPFHEISEWKNL